MNYYGNYNKTTRHSDMEAPQTNGKKKIIILHLKCYKRQSLVKRSLQKIKKKHFSYSRLCLIHKNILSLHRITKTATKLLKIFNKNKLKLIIMEIYIIKCKAFGEKNLFFVLSKKVAEKICKELNERLGLRNLYYIEPLKYFEYE